MVNKDVKENTSSPSKAKKDKLLRRAEALRRNLRKRKDQQRIRSSIEETGESVPINSESPQILSEIAHGSPSLFSKDS